MTEEQISDANADFHQRMAELYTEQTANLPFSRESFSGNEQWKNRFKVNCKIRDPDAYAYLFAYAKARHLSLNSAINEILETFFQPLKK